MLTGLVYAAVVILWAAVLVPRWMRRHDRNAARRTTVTFHRAMATLERRRSRHSTSRASHNIDVVVAGARSRVHDRTRVTRATSGSPSGIDRHLDLGIDPFEGSEQELHLRDARLARSRMVARESAAKRRRHVRQTLTALNVIALILHVMGPLPLLLTALPPIGLALFWFAGRQEATRPTASRERTRDSAKQARSAAPARSAGRAAAGRRAQRHVEPAAVRAPTNVAEADDQGVGSPDVRLLGPDEVAVRRLPVASGQWDAVESPLPSHMVGARADRRPVSRRRGDWTAERMLEQVEALRAPGQDVEAELGLDEFVDIPYAGPTEHLRAVND